MLVVHAYLDGELDPANALEIEQRMRTDPQLAGPVLTSPNLISTLPQRFACARLSRPCLPGSCPDVSATFTTVAF